MPDDQYAIDMFLDSGKIEHFTVTEEAARRFMSLPIGREHEFTIITDGKYWKVDCVAIQAITCVPLLPEQVQEAQQALEATDAT